MKIFKDAFVDALSTPRWQHACNRATAALLKIDRVQIASTTCLDQSTCSPHREYAGSPEEQCRDRRSQSSSPVQQCLNCRVRLSPRRYRRRELQTQEAFSAEKPDETSAEITQAATLRVTWNKAQERNGQREVWWKVCWSEQCRVAGLFDRVHEVASLDRCWVLSVTRGSRRSPP
jgi:hypothetical protein